MKALIPSGEGVAIDSPKPLIPLSVSISINIISVVFITPCDQK